MPLLRSSLLLAVALTLALASGAAAAQIDFDDDLDMLRVVDFSAAADQLTIRELPANHEITDPSGTLFDNSGLCVAIAGGFRCPKATSIAVDLGGQNDVFRGLDRDSADGDRRRRRERRHRRRRGP